MHKKPALSHYQVSEFSHLIRVNNGVKSQVSLAAVNSACNSSKHTETDFAGLDELVREKTVNIF